MLFVLKFKSVKVELRTIKDASLQIKVSYPEPKVAIKKMLLGIPDEAFVRSHFRS